MADSADMNPATSVYGDSFAPSDGLALMRALHENQERQRREATEARYSHRIVTAAGIDPDQLSDQGQRILAWLCGWDDWTVGGLVEILGATRTAALGALYRGALDRKVEALRESEAAVDAALARDDQRETSTGRDADGACRDTVPETWDVSGCGTGGAR